MKLSLMFYKVASNLLLQRLKLTGQVTQIGLDKGSWRSAIGSDPSICHYTLFTLGQKKKEIYIYTLDLEIFLKSQKSPKPP